MVSFAIVEDDPRDVEILRNYFQQLTRDCEETLELAFYASSKAFLLEFNYGKFDIVLMDIDLPGLNGLQTSAKLRDIDPDVTLIFMTNLAQFAIEGYKVKARDYLVKPISFFDFKSSILSAIESLGERRKTRVLISENDRKVVIALKDIYYVEVKDHVLLYHTKNGIFRTYGTPLKKLSQDLAKAGFSLCNSCFLVNLSYVESVEGFNVVVHGEPLLISHPKRKAFLNDLNVFLGHL